MNRLQFETSPYLLQHAHNPVDWFAWKPEAFERARAEGKPILVSIGYSTCHWCHVMERESFENEDIASVMNEHFVCIKVDREERPDVDHIYMEACQILTGSGGWPLNCFLTPAGKPFFAGTYYPPRPAHGRPSWLQLLLHMANIWETRRADAEEQAEKLMGHIRRNDDVFVQKQPAAPSQFPLDAQPPVPPLLENIFYRMREQFDRAEGGFGGAPKFPSAMSLHFLLDYHHLTGNAEAREHALFSLDRMIFGGIYDQIGGGFARYATDREWLVPHFEKMLYDNALLVRLLAEAHKLTKNERYRETIEETLGWLFREMTHPAGGFFSALDADSEGVEGKFYVWQKAEIKAALGDDAPLFCQFYGATEHGNWEETNILWRAQGIEDFAEKHGFDAVFLQKRLLACREKLLAVREMRSRPGLDDKVLLGWNALMASGLAAAFAALGREEYRAAAVRNVAFLLENFAGPDGGMLHTWKDGVAQYEAFLEDYAFLIAALVDVHQVTFEQRFLTAAERLTERVLAKFYDPETGLFFFTGAEQADVPLRRKDLFDNATPSGNSTMAHNLQRLALLLGRPEWSESASRMLAAMRETVERYPLSFGRWAAGLLAEAHPGPEIAVIGEDALAVAGAINARFLPNKVIAASRAETGELPLLAGKQSGGAAAWIYVCRDFACQKPVKTMEEFARLTAHGFVGGASNHNISAI